MSVLVRYTIRCDGCGQESTAEAETESKARRDAARGWRRVGCAGMEADACPRCARTRRGEPS